MKGPELVFWIVVATLIVEAIKYAFVTTTTYLAAWYDSTRFHRRLRSKEVGDPRRKVG